MTDNPIAGVSQLIDLPLEMLAIGMYVILPASWGNHPFVHNAFIITTVDQIEKIKDQGFKRITIDPTKGLDSALDADTIAHAVPEERPTEEKSSTLPEGFKETLNNETMPPQQKAAETYMLGYELMLRLEKDLKPETLITVKEGIREIVDLILREDETTVHLARILKHDHRTATHSLNVGILGLTLAKQLYRGSTHHDYHEIGIGLFLHDIGKSRVDPAVLNKPGRLDRREMMQMRKHSWEGCKILRSIGELSMPVETVVLQHHERADGSGYPRHLSGDEIHEYGRLACIADCFDAITAKTTWRPARTTFETLNLMREELLHHFHVEMFKEFVLLFRDA